MASSSGAQSRGTVRIVGGTWRGRKLPVVDSPGLRPSGDRCRETLFNWLQPHIEGVRCADLFAGTGALGFEAASRGARQVTLVERSRSISAVLSESAAMLGATAVEVVTADALEWLARCAPASLDIVFIDPPFDSDLAEDALQSLLQRRTLAPGAMVYVESPVDRLPTIPAGLVEFKSKRMGEVHMCLLKPAPCE